MVGGRGAGSLGRNMSGRTPTPDEQRRLLGEALDAAGGGIRGGGEVAPYGVGGESRTFLVGDDLLVSVPLGWPADTPSPDDLDRAAELHRRVAARTSVPVPEVVAVHHDAGFLVHRRLPGEPLLAVAPQAREQAVPAVAAAVGTLLGDLHRCDVADLADVAEADEHSPAAWLEETAATVDALGDRLDAEQQRDARRFLALPAPGPPAGLRFSHNDLGIEHVLVTPGPDGLAVSGVIDWGDAAITDPAYDLGLLLRDLGPGALRLALETYATRSRPDPGTAERAVFYARCTLLEDLAFGLETGRAAYVAKSRAGWRWTFDPALD